MHNWKCPRAANRNRKEGMQYLNNPVEDPQMEVTTATVFREHGEGVVAGKLDNSTYLRFL